MADFTLPPSYKLTPDSHVISYMGWRQWGRHPESGRLLAEVPNKYGYLYVRVQTSEGKRERRYIHQLVAWAYTGPRPSPQHEVRHLDGNNTNNTKDNIAWGTRSENALDREKHGGSELAALRGVAIRAGQLASTNPYWRHAR